MGCNCGKSMSPRQKWVYKSPDGSTVTYTSEIQAKAAQIKHGGGTITVVQT